MIGFARGMGYMYVLVGLMVAFFPRMAKRMIEVRAEFAKLSPPAMRMLGAWIMMTGVTMVGATTRISVISSGVKLRAEARGEGEEHLRRAA